MSNKLYKVGVVGATGAVGQEMIKVLHQRSFPVSELHLFASPRSEGMEIETGFGRVKVVVFSVERAREMDFVFLAVSGTFALEHARAIASPGGPIVIDNSSAFRLEEDVPLVIPEINGCDIQESRLIANPNCTTAIASMALYPLHSRYGIKKIIISTYQAASGAGAEGMEELRQGTNSYLIGENISNKVFAHPLPFNVIPHIDNFQSNSYTKEEMKVAWETRKIFNDNDIAISCTAVRIPTFRAHAESITIETHDEIVADEARKLLLSSPGVQVVDNPQMKEYPMPLNASEKEDVQVGRIRNNTVFGSYGLDLFVCGDQLLRGAALNAVLIAEYIVKPFAISYPTSKKVSQPCKWPTMDCRFVGAIAAGSFALGAILYRKL